MSHWINSVRDADEQEMQEQALHGALLVLEDRIHAFTTATEGPINVHLPGDLYRLAGPMRDAARTLARLAGPALPSLALNAALSDKHFLNVNRCKELCQQVRRSLRAWPIAA